MIGSLLYLTTNHYEITFFVGLYDRYQSNPKVMYLTQVKRIIKYINAIAYYGILYSFDTNSSLICCDAVGERMLKIEKKLVNISFLEII